MFMCMSRLVEYIKENDGMTYNPRKGVFVSSGYACAKAENEKIIDGAITEYDLTIYLYRSQKDLQNTNAMLGVWYNTENEKTYIDTSFVFENVDDAKRFGKENNQIAIFHLDTFTEIRL